MKLGMPAQSQWEEGGARLGHGRGEGPCLYTPLLCLGPLARVRSAAILPHFAASCIDLESFCCVLHGFCVKLLILQKMSSFSKE